MLIQLTKADTFVHRAECDHPSGVPVEWALIAEADNKRTPIQFAVVYRELEQNAKGDPWVLEWRGAYDRCREVYMEAVIDAVMGDMLHGLPNTAMAALRAGRTDG